MSPPPDLGVLVTDSRAASRALRVGPSESGERLGRRLVGSEVRAGTMAGMTGDDDGQDGSNLPPTEAEEVAWLLQASRGAAHAMPAPNISMSDINRGRGVFSRVLRLRIEHNGGVEFAVAKLPALGPNRRAGIAGGAYRREAHFYRKILPLSRSTTPPARAVIDNNDGSTSLLLEDLSHHRWPDQMAGLDPGDAVATAKLLAEFHDQWRGADGLESITADAEVTEEVRSNTVGGLDPGALDRGLDVIRTRWARVLTQRQIAALAALAGDHHTLARDFGRAGPITLCHGDPRADNLAFTSGGQPILIDWQQTAFQFGEADLAWLAATSLDPVVRRSLEPGLVAAYGGDRDLYRLGLVLPALAVMMLAQRSVDSARTEQLIISSLRRIAAAVVDNL